MAAGSREALCGPGAGDAIDTTSSTFTLTFDSQDGTDQTWSVGTNGLAVTCAVVTTLLILVASVAADRRYLGEATMALLTTPTPQEGVATPELMTA